MNMNNLLTLSVESRASDLHVSAGMPPMLRIDGELQLLDRPVIEDKQAQDLLYSIMSEAQRQQFETRHAVDFAIELSGLARFRVNVFKQNRGIGAVLRTIATRVMSLDDLGLPLVLKDLADKRHGLVLITGPTGSGKSTSLAAMIDYLNNKRQAHILTIEDPIEFVHQSKKCLINQREVSRDTHSFSDALRSALREDPDIILVGELRDLETIRLALTAAETGHLVFATLHTSSAAKSINRIVDVFPAEEKGMARSLLSESLQGVVSQTLLKKPQGGRIAAYEIMVCTPAVRHLIREDKVAQMYSTIQTGKAFGMQTLEQHLQQLVNEGLVNKAVIHESS